MPEQRRRRPTRRRGGDEWVAVLILVAASGAFLPLLQRLAEEGRQSGNPVTIAIWVGFYLFAAARLAPEWRLWVGRFLREWAILAVLAWAMVSVAWSLDPELTLRRSVALVGTSVVGLWFAIRFSVRGLLRILVLTSLVVAGSSFVAGLIGTAVDPRHAAVGSWRGVFESKNLMAQLMVLSLPACMIQLRSQLKRWRWLGAAGLAASGTLLVLSGSATGMGIAPLVLAAWAVFYIAPRLPRKAAGLGLLLVAGVLLQVILISSDVVRVDPDAVLSTVGRDATLTGRTDIWALSWEQIQHRPLLGYGHGAFWTGPFGEGSGVVARGFGQDPGYAHNGFIDAVLGFGFLGLALVLVSMIGTTALGVRYLKATTGWRAPWPLTFVAFLVLANLTEGGLVQQNHYMWLLYVAVAVRLRIDVDDEGVSRPVSTAG